MGPVIASFDVAVVIRAPEDLEAAEVDAPTIAELEAAVEAAVTENVSGNGTLVTVNATATRTDI